MSSETVLEEQVLEIESPFIIPEFEQSPFQVKVLRVDGKHKVVPIGLEEHGRHLYFLGYQNLGLKEPGRFYLLHGSVPLEKGKRPDIKAEDLGLDFGYEMRLMSLPVKSINYSHSVVDDILVYFDKGFTSGSHKGSLVLPGSRRGNDGNQPRILLNYQIDPKLNLVKSPANREYQVDRRSPAAQSGHLAFPRERVLHQYIRNLD